MRRAPHTADSAAVSDTRLDLSVAVLGALFYITAVMYAINDDNNDDDDDDDDDEDDRSSHARADVCAFHSFSFDAAVTRIGFSVLYSGHKVSHMNFYYYYWTRNGVPRSRGNVHHDIFDYNMESRVSLTVARDLEPAICQHGYTLRCNFFSCSI
jgi:hypothetical protein